MLLVKGKIKNALAAQIGVFWWVFHLPRILKKRKYVQEKIRRVSDDEFIPKIKHNPPFPYYLHFFTNPEGKYKEAPLK
jgi:hypothetical protein